MSFSLLEEQAVHNPDEVGVFPHVLRRPHLVMTGGWARWPRSDGNDLLPTCKLQVVKEVQRFQAHLCIPQESDLPSPSGP